MPRLRQPKVSETYEPFDSTKVKPVEEPKEELEPQLMASEPQDEEVTIEAPKEPEKPVAAASESKPDDASAALQKQLEKIRESEALLAKVQQERDEAIKRAREYEIEQAKQQRRTVQAQYESVATALRASKEKLEFAERDLRAAKANGDVDAEIEATKRMSAANAEILTLEPGVEELKDKRRSEKKKVRELRKQDEKTPEQPRQLSVDEQIDSYNLPPTEKQWLRDRPQYVTDKAKVDRLGFAVRELDRQGIKVGMPGFIPELEVMLDRFEGHKAKEPEPEQRTSIVSAPVSREVASTGSGQRPTSKVTLTREEVEFARITGVTPAEYARQKAKLAEMKANGEYGERR